MGVVFSEYDDASPGSLLSPPPPPCRAGAAAEFAGGTKTNTASVVASETGLAPAGESAEPATDTGHTSLAALAGVRSTDAAVACQDTPGKRRPRLTCTPGQAAIIMLILIGALCASLGLLIRQSVNLARLDGHDAATHASVAPTTGSAFASPNDATPDAGTVAGGQSQAGEDGQSGRSGAVQQSDAPAPTPAATDDGRIDINTADAAQLQTLNGVGPVTAQRIIDYRNEHGRFSSVDDLLNVSGIGAKTLEKLRAQAVVR